MDLSSGMKMKRQEMGDPHSQFMADCPCLYGCESHRRTESISFINGMEILRATITKATRIFEDSSTDFTADDLKQAYLYAFPLIAPNRFSPSQAFTIFSFYKYSLMDCIHRKIIPALDGTRDERSLLSKLVHLWEKYSIMGAWLAEILEPLNWFYLDNRGVTVRSISIGTFYDEIGPTTFAKFTNAAIQLIDKDMKGDLMNQELLTKVVQFFINMKEVDDGKEFEELESSVLYYFKKSFSRLARMWISQKRPVVYLKKVELCFELVQTRMSLYFPPATVAKFLKVGRSRLLDRHVFNLIEQVFHF